MLLYSLINAATSIAPFQSPIFTNCFHPISPDHPFSGRKSGFLKITRPPTDVETNLSATDGKRIP